MQLYGISSEGLQIWYICIRDQNKVCFAQQEFYITPAIAAVGVLKTWRTSTGSKIARISETQPGNQKPQLLSDSQVDL